MTSCRASFLISTLILALALPALARAAVEPLQLSPATAGALPDAPLPDAPLPDAPTPDPVPLPTSGPRGISGVEVQELRAPDPSGVGVLDEKQGLGTEMWDGTSAATVRRFLPQLPAATASPALRGLMRRLLLTAAAVPDGGTGQPSLLQLRAERLYAMGELDGLTALLKVVPAATMTPALLRLKLEALLLGGDLAGACAGLPQVLAGGAGGEMAKLQVLCHLTGGRMLEGNLGLDLMREHKDADHAFIAAAEVLGGLAPAKLDKLPAPAPIHLAAFRAAKLPLPAEVVERAGPALLRALAQAPEQPVDLRLAAAERAEALGALDTDALRLLYGTLAFTPAELEAPLAGAAADKGVRTRALLFRAAQVQALPSARAEIIARAMALAGQRGQTMAAARLYAPLVAEMDPAAGPGAAPPSFAPLAARLLYATGHAERAAKWLEAARHHEDTATAAAELWPLERLNDPKEDKATPPAVIAAWRNARQLPPEQAERRAAVVLGLLSAVGERIPAAEWLSMLEGSLAAAGPGPRPALWHMLRLAADQLQLGETVMLSLITLGDQGLDRTDPQSLFRVVAALRLLGLDKEARALAVEAALANGI